MKTIIVIPARMASTRLPRKPLHDLLGTSMIMHVYHRCKLSRLADDVIVATDHEEIYNHVMTHKGKAMMTKSTHTSGTDRVGEVLQLTDGDIYINVQGDEPLIDPRQIDNLIQSIIESDASIATQCKKIENSDDLFDYNVVKVVTDSHHNAMYFSRQAIPAFRDKPYKQWFDAHDYYRHIGIYAFKRDVLATIIKWPASSYERVESLEQLRWLQGGLSIHCAPTNYFSLGVDTPEDAEKVIEYMITKMNS
jgi:3-deoxy-manno-octulosonate cytidylyltransferase (CMP-KDO synthetase)